jgi:hypothetical protein
MEKRALISEFKGFSPKRQSEFLLLLLVNLTVSARVVMHESSDAYKLEFFAGLNEIFHSVAGEIFARLRDDPPRYPDDVLLGMIYDIAEGKRFLPHLHAAWNLSLLVRE